ncbi:hypothetical protein CR152_05420 [Massilia violaceinigra]|uniref:Uncharacterized protein n=2 Tax=Massilia violaceinigra TaxID=2045208 RepID=A0A2D2DGC2_9BURK|nr:hypothetical protein CR152_05420 [Massilia violaceinigra]
MAATVEKAILLKDTVSVHQAAIYLASGGVPLDVTGRVLTTPYRRGMVRSGVSDEAYTTLPATPAAPPVRVPATAPAAAPAAAPAPASAAAPAPVPPALAQSAAPALPQPLRDAEAVQDTVTVPQMVPGTPPAVRSSWRDIIHSAGPTFR